MLQSLWIIKLANVSSLILVYNPFISIHLGGDQHVRGWEEEEQRSSYGTIKVRMID